MSVACGTSAGTVCSVKTLAYMLDLTYGSCSEQYGPVFRYRGAEKQALAIIDPKAIQYICLTNPYGFEKPTEESKGVEMMTGRGLLVAEGDQHKLHRKVLAPAFTLSYKRKAITPPWWNMLTRYVLATYSCTSFEPN